MVHINLNGCGTAQAKMNTAWSYQLGVYVNDLDRWIFRYTDIFLMTEYSQFCRCQDSPQNSW